MKYGFIIDNRKCIGCHACTVACKAEHQTPLGVNRTWVKYIEKGEFPHTRRHFTVLRCNHCSDAPCVEICPVRALYRREDGIVDFDNRRCIGCKACTQACPYDALHIDPDTHTASKCNYCAHRIDIGLEPACVIVCPEHAIVSGDLDDPQSEISLLLSKQPVSVRKPEKGTSPNLFYIEGERAALEPSASRSEGDYLWSSQSAGVGHYARFAEQRLARTGNGGSLQTSTGGPSLPPRAPSPAAESQARRVYDAPDKGVAWGWEVTAYLWTKSIAAGVFLVPFIFLLVLGRGVPGPILWWSTVLALVFLGLTGLLLIRDLDRPDRFLYVLLRPQWRSWLTRGSYIITAYGLVLTGWMAAGLANLGGLQVALAWLGLPLAAATAVYTAFLFAQAKGRDFWQSPLLSFHFMTHALMAGSAVAGIIGLFLGGPAVWLEGIRVFLMAAIVFHLLSLAAELATGHPTEDARRVGVDILRGRFRTLFWVGSVAAGSLLPLLLAASGLPVLLGAAGLATLLGIYLTEHIWVRAPQLVPLS